MENVSVSGMDSITPSLVVHNRSTRVRRVGTQVSLDSSNQAVPATASADRSTLPCQALSIVVGGHQIGADVAQELT
jgi:hypothetical protein